MADNIDQYIEQIRMEPDFFTKARLLQFLHGEKGVRTTDLAKKMNLKPSFLCHLLRLNRIPDIVIDGYYAKMVTISHLFIISRLKEPAQIIALYERILKDNLTIVQTEEAVREINYRVKSTGQYLTKEETQQFLNQLPLRFKNSTIKITQTRIKSKLVWEIKGNLAETTAALKQILAALMK